jgi:hypothetical protein
MPLSRQARRRICQLGAKKLVSQSAARGKHGVPIEMATQRKQDEEELRRRLWKSAPAEAYLPNVIEDESAAPVLFGPPADPEDLKRTAGGIYLP